MFARNLLILQSTWEQDPSDWITIQHRIEREAPDIEVRIANNGSANSVTARWQVRRPSLVFSPIRLIDFVPRGGAVFCGHILGKDEQLLRLSSIGILTPRTETLCPGASFDPNEWGDYVIVKPNNLNSGQGVRLVRAVDVYARCAELTAAANDSFLVQPFIDHSEDGYPTEYRVLTLFGRTLYCARNRWGNVRPSLAEIANNPLGIIASNNKRWVAASAQSVMTQRSSPWVSVRTKHFQNARCSALTLTVKARQGDCMYLRSIHTVPFGTCRRPSQGRWTPSMSATFTRNSMRWIAPPTF